MKRPPRNETWGARTFDLIDPFGNTIFVIGPETWDPRCTTRAPERGHPHILTLIDSGASDGVLYYVLPFVRGESLRDLLNREKQLSLEQALAITRHIAGALDYAHKKGVVHRDIKPENI